MSSPTTNPANFTVMKVSALSCAQTAADIGIALDGSTRFSVDAWVRFNGLCSRASILSKDGVFNFGIIGDSLVLAIAGYPSVQSDPSQQALDDDTWHYVCVTYDGVSVRLYIDGEFNYMQGIAGTGSSNGNLFLIGSELQALIQNVRVYNTSLDADTVMLNMFGEPSAANIVAYFDFTQVPPVDRGSGHLPIQLQSGAVMITSTPALALKGPAYAQPLRDDHVNPGGYQVDPYTIQAWVYVESTDNAQQVIFINSDLESDSGMALYLQYDADAAGFRVNSQRGANVTANTLSSTALVQPNTWVNLATTFDGTTLVVYIQGTLDSSGSFGPIPLIRDTSNLLIGAALSQGLPLGMMAFQGYISRVDVWTRVLSAAEITQYMSQVPDVGATGIAAVYDLTSSPARNHVDGHPIGLADGAEISSQVSHALPSVPQLDQATLQAIRDSLDFTDFLANHGQLLEEALESDVRAFVGKPADQQRVRDAWRDAIDRMRNDPRSVRFMVTTHQIGAEYVLLCHTRSGTYVAYRADAATINDCTMWKVTLVFVVVAGVLDALFGLRATLNPRAVSYIGRVLANPRIAALMANGQWMSAPLIFTLASTIYQLGFFRELLNLIIDVGFWTLLRVVGKLALKLLGVGAADVIASLVATAITFIKVYVLDRPSSCDPLPTVALAAIKFNYDPTAVAVDALSIRRNYTTPVSVPEWTSGKTRAEDSPAAYSIAAVTGRTIAIQAAFTISVNNATQVRIKADGGGILGAIDPVTISFNSGVSSPQFVTLQLPHHTIATGGIQRQDIQWTWSYQIGSGAWTVIGTTAHRIYTVLATPTMPWVQSPSTSETQLPWTDVLDYACQWAQGKTTLDDATTAVARQVNGSIGLAYDTSGGASSYTYSNQFLCTQFIVFLKTGVGKGNKVNCTDCATIVTTFANVLGCNVFASIMCQAGTGGFDTNKIVAIGYTTWAYPFKVGKFNYHEVAWTGAGSYTDPLYDACLHVDSGSNPWNWTDPTITHTPQLPLKMPFTTRGINPTLPIATPFTDQSYRERLSQNTANGIGRCVPVGTEPYTQSGRRSVI